MADDASTRLACRSAAGSVRAARWRIVRSWWPTSATGTIVEVWQHAENRSTYDEFFSEALPPEGLLWRLCTLAWPLHFAEVHPKTNDHTFTGIAGTPKGTCPS